jgi:hypothetical protein
MKRSPSTQKLAQSAERLPPKSLSPAPFSHDKAEKASASLSASIGTPASSSISKKGHDLCFSLFFFSPYFRPLTFFADDEDELEKILAITSTAELGQMTTKKKGLCSFPPRLLLYPSRIKFCAYIF